LDPNSYRNVHVRLLPIKLIYLSRNKMFIRIFGLLLFFDIVFDLCSSVVDTSVYFRWDNQGPSVVVWMKKRPEGKGR